MAKQFYEVAKISKIPLAPIIYVEAGGEEIAICNTSDGITAISALCTRGGGSLDQGVLENDIIECPRHRAHFNVSTGKVVTPPAVTPVETYEVQVQGEKVLVVMES